jgi:uncharacterized protein (UPF0333 family)
MIKKGQVQTQVFVYIMVIVVAAGILIYGYQAIKGFKKSADDILYAQFKNNLESDLKALTFGSVKVKAYELPSKAEQVCFKTSDAQRADVVTEENIRNIEYRLIKDAIGVGTKDNVFLYPKGETSFFTGINLELGEDAKFKCFDVKNGKLTITIEGKGRSILIS